MTFCCQWLLWYKLQLSKLNGFKSHARRGWIFVLRVLDCNEKYWYFFLYRKSLNMYKFMELWKIFSEKNYVNRKIKHVKCQISPPSPLSWKFCIHNASQSQCDHRLVMKCEWLFRYDKDVQLWAHIYKGLLNIHTSDKWTLCPVIFISIINSITFWFPL